VFCVFLFMFILVVPVDRAAWRQAALWVHATPLQVVVVASVASRLSMAPDVYLLVGRRDISRTATMPLMPRRLRSPASGPCAWWPPWRSRRRWICRALTRRGCQHARETPGLMGTIKARTAVARVDREHRRIRQPFVEHVTQAGDGDSRVEGAASACAASSWARIRHGGQ
jgi:hypothetical protein